MGNGSLPRNFYFNQKHEMEIASKNNLVRVTSGQSSDHFLALEILTKLTVFLRNKISVIDMLLVIHN